MGIIEKIKELFQQEKPEKPENKELRISELESWLKEKKEENEKYLEEKTNYLYNELFLLLKKLEEEIEILEKIDLKNRKELEKIKQITEIGKRDYLQTVKNLIESLKEKKQIPYIGTEIDKFALYSAKSHSKATLLIGKEIEVMTNTITAIRKLENDFIKNNKESIKNINQLKSLIENVKEINNNEEIKKRIKKEMESVKEEIKGYENKFNEIEIEIKEIKESPEFKKKEDLISAMRYKEEALKNLESNIKTIIDKRILEKYLYIEQDKKNSKNIQKYIDDPIKAILLDYEFEILSILEDIKQKIKNKTITPKSPEKVIARMSIGKENLLEYKNRIIKITEEIENLEKQTDIIKIKTPELKNEKIIIENKLEENKNLLEALSKKNEKIQYALNEKLPELNSKLIEQNIKLIT